MWKDFLGKLKDNEQACTKLRGINKVMGIFPQCQAAGDSTIKEQKALLSKET